MCLRYQILRNNWKCDFLTISSPMEAVEMQLPLVYLIIFMLYVCLSRNKSKFCIVISRNHFVPSNCYPPARCVVQLSIPGRISTSTPAEITTDRLLLTTIHVKLRIYFFSIRYKTCSSTERPDRACRRYDIK